MTSKQQAFKDLTRYYMDRNGAVTLNKAKIGGEPDNENPHYFNGIAALLAKVNNLKSIEFDIYINKHIRLKEVATGLYERQIGDHKKDVDKDGVHRLSLDEHIGLCLLAAYDWENLSWVARTLYRHGHENDWMFIEEDPYRDKEWNDTIFYINRIRQPYVRLFIKAMSLNFIDEIRFTEVLDLAGKIISSCDKEYLDTSGKLKSFFILKGLEIILHKSIILSITKKIFIYKMKKMYGSNYFEALIGIYFKDKEHPFHKLSEGVKL